jgi:nucleotide-binding universal stress UspA family protein
MIISGQQAHTCAQSGTSHIGFAVIEGHLTSVNHHIGWFAIVYVFNIQEIIMPKHQLYLVAVDGSEWGGRAADYAVRLAKQTGAKVKLITVIPWSGFQPMTLDEIAHRPLEKQHEEDIARESVLDPILEKHADSGVDISSEFQWGHPVQLVRDAAKKDRATMVFVGRRGRSQIADLVLGSVAHSLAHSLGVPIVLVP